jgi:hypothetical protein
MEDKEPEEKTYNKETREIKGKLVVCWGGHSNHAE